VVAMLVRDGGCSEHGDGQRKGDETGGGHGVSPEWMRIRSGDAGGDTGWVG
jgi:hypothetical protein